MFCLVWWNIGDVPLYQALDFSLVPRGDGEMGGILITGNI